MNHTAIAFMSYVNNSSRLERPMTTPQKKRPTSPDLLGSEIAIKRAAQRAREIALQTNTPCIVRQDGKLVDVTKQSISVTN